MFKSTNLKVFEGGGESKEEPIQYSQNLIRLPMPEEVGEPYGSGSSVTRLYLKSDTFDFRYRHNNV